MGCCCSNRRGRRRGFEWAVWNNWSIKLEYQYFDFGAKRVTLVAPDNGPVPADIKQRIETVTFGINYRFGWGSTPASSVGAKY